MTRFTLSGIAAAILIALTATQSQAAIILANNGTGNLNAYELVTGPQQNWAGAKTASQIPFPGLGGIPASGVIGHLGTISNATENAVFQTLTSGDPWIGLTDKPGDAPGAFEGGNQTGFPVPANGSTPTAGQRGFGWAWVTGEPLVFHNWNGTGEPNGNTGENHVQLQGNSTWNDLNESSVRNYIREWDLNLSLNQLPLGGWNSTTHKRPGNANISDGGSGNGFGGSQSVIDALNNGPVIGSGVVNSVNYADLNNQGGGGNFPNSFNPFGLDGGIDDQHFVVKSTGFLQIGIAGNYQFRNNTDDGSRLRLDLNGNGTFEANETIILDDILFGDHNADSAIIGLTPGQYMIEHVWYERDGGAEGDLGVAFNGGAFQLFGNPRADGFGAFITSGIFVTQQAIVPEPASLSMLALGGLALLRRRRTA